MTGYRKSDEIAEALVRLHGNPLLRERLSMGALYTAKERSWDSVMVELMHSYDRALQGAVEVHAV